MAGGNQRGPNPSLPRPNIIPERDYPYSQPTAPCVHEHLDFDGICRACGADCRGIDYGS